MANCRALPSIVVGILCLSPFAKLLIPNDRVIPVGDYVRYQVPVRDFARQEMLEGSFPLWIPYLGLGTPVHASQQGAFCYPLLMPLALIFGANAGNKMALFLHLLLCFIGQYRLARSFSISALSSTFAALAATQSGFLTAHLCAGHVNLILQYALLPWFFLSLKSFLENPGPRSAAMLCVFVTGFVFAGHPQVGYYGILAGTLWWIGSFILGRASAHRLRCAVWTTVAAAIAVLLSAVQLAPSLELVRDGLSMGERGSKEVAGHFALELTDLWQFVLPTHNGHLFAGIPEFNSRELYQERAGYIGILTPPLALLSLTGRSGSRWQWAIAAFTVLCVIISLGNHTPLFGALGRALPGLFLFRCPGRIFSVLSVFGSLAAASGLDMMAGNRARPNALCFAVAAAGWLFANYLAYALLDSPLPYQRFAERHLVADVAVLGGIILAYAATAALWWRARLSAKTMCVAVLFLTSLDLWYFNAQYFQLEPRPDAAIPSVLLAERPPLRFIEDAETISCVHLHYSEFTHAAIIDRRTTLGTNEGGVLPGALERIYRAVESNRKTTANLSGCNYEYSTGDRRWKTRRGAMPRIWFCRDDDAAICTAPLERVSCDELTNYVDQSAEIMVSADQPQRLNLRVKTSSPGKLIIADIFYPGWQCRVNQADIPLERAFSVFRAIGIDAGESNIELRYEPASFRYGLLGSVLGLFLLALLLFRGRSTRASSDSGVRSDESLGRHALVLLALVPLEVVLMGWLGNRQIADSVMRPMSAKIDATTSSK